MHNARLLLELLWKPGAAMSRILDGGSLLFATVAVLVVSLLLQGGLSTALPQPPPTIQQFQGAAADQDQIPVRIPRARPWWSFSFYSPLLVLAVIYVPGTLLVTNLLARLGSLGVVFERDYSALLTCTSMAWVASQLPIVPASWFLPLPLLAAVAALAYLYFAVLMFFAIRTVFGTENGIAVGAVGLSVIPLAASVVFWAPLRMVLSWLASPFFLFYAYYFLAGEFTSLGTGMRRRQSFHKMLETAAINPHDADAQYELGLIYQQRHQYTEAIQRFRSAVAIDSSETDAHFQLGRIAREQGRLRDALVHFQTVIDQDDRHNLSEILRELGATYLAARQYQDARNELAEYIERRPYDPEGLFDYGQAFEGLGDAAQAREMYRRAIEAVRTAPRYRRRLTAKWSRLAQRQIRKLPRKV
ncbi:MAG TPA: tetratricopeptide repeat protein [Bryobacteraceae bacterium]|nr:tetratricopeptide repeat protein [Bryobacteraceae bacterium]